MRRTPAPAPVMGVGGATLGVEPGIMEAGKGLGAEEAEVITTRGGEWGAELAASM
jgi:hypothetical protein